MFTLTGTRALVTGAGDSHGIGFAAARALVEHGAHVHLTGMSDRVLERAGRLVASGFSASASTADLRDADQAAEVVATAERLLGGLDVIVNNAGMVAAGDAGKDESGSAAELTDAGWRDALGRNLDTAFYATRAALPALRASGRGRIIMISSVTGPVMAMRSDAGYAAAKAGMVGLMRSLAIDEAQHGITANAIAPGWIATGSQTEHEAEQGLRTPLGRSGTPDEVAGAVVWLVTAGYVTGQVITIDGGNSIAEERS
jgi:3-oxoacyl-[acyl-carrier protein] reductase